MAGSKDKMQGSITIRTIILAFLLVIPNSYLSIQTPTATAMSMVYPVIFNLLLLLAINLPLKKWLPKHAFTQSELLTVYIVLSLTTIVSGLDMVQVLVPLLGHWAYYSTPENEWITLFGQYLPKWLTVDNMEVLEEYYKGESSFHSVDIMRAWAQPILWWSVFFFLLMMIMLLLALWTLRMASGRPLSPVIFQIFPKAHISELILGIHQQ